MKPEECLQLIEKVVKAFDESVYMLALWHQDAYLELKLYAVGIEAAVKGEDISGRVYIDPFSAVVEADAKCEKCKLKAKSIGSLFVVETCKEEKEFSAVEINGVKYASEEFYNFIGEKFKAVSRRIMEYILRRKT